MGKRPPWPPVSDPGFFRRVTELALVFAVIIVTVLLLRLVLVKDEPYQDPVTEQIALEMSEDRTMTLGSGRRTVAEFMDPIILEHGQTSELIVHTATLSETVSIASEGLFGWSWASAYQDIEYEGVAQYTVDLSRLTGEDFMVNNEEKVLTVKIPYAVLKPINIPADQIKFHDLERGWAGVKEINMTAEEAAQLEIQVEDMMKAKLIEEDVMAQANEDAKAVVEELLSATVRSVDPGFTVVVVQ